MRYRTSDLPAAGVGAFMPLPTLGPAASSWGKVVRAGMPGTTPMPSPTPGWLPSLTARGGVNSAQGHSVSPDVFAPSVYVAYANGQGPTDDAGLGMARRRLNELPVPAQNPLRNPNVSGVYQPARIGGRAQVPWPRVFQRFPNFRGGSGG